MINRVLIIFLHRLLSHHIQSGLSPSQLPTLLRTLRGVLFPNNAPGQSTLRPPSSEDELLALRRRAASALWRLLPRGVTRLYLGGGLLGGEASDQHGAEVDQIEHLLMVLDDEYCNKHLVYGVLELILIRVMPEMSEQGVAELWEERLGS